VGSCQNSRKFPPGIFKDTGLSTAGDILSKILECTCDRAEREPITETWIAPQPKCRVRAPGQG